MITPRAASLLFWLQAVSTGVIRLLNQADFICSTYRDHVHALSKNVPPREIMAELFGKKTGICRGQGGSMHMFSKKHGLVGTYFNNLEAANNPLNQLSVFDAFCCCKISDTDRHSSLCCQADTCVLTVQLGGFAFIGEGIPVGLGAAFGIKYRKVGQAKRSAETLSSNTVRLCPGKRR